MGQLLPLLVLVGGAVSALAQDSQAPRGVLDLETGMGSVGPYEGLEAAARVGEVVPEHGIRVLAAGQDRAGQDWARVQVLEGEEHERPAGLLVEGSGRARRLAWEPRDGQEYIVLRRALEPGAEDVELGRGVLASFLDEDPLDGPAHYTVREVEAVAGAVVLDPGEREPFEQPIILRPGLRLNLLTGLEAGADAHIEVRYAASSAVFLETQEPVVLSVPSGVDWRAPEPGAGAWSGNSHSLRVNQEVFAHLPEGLFLRLRFEERDGSIVLLRELGPWGGVLIPRRLVGGEVQRGGARPRLAFEIDGGEEWLEHFELAVELEERFGSNAWSELTRLPATRPVLDLEDQPPGQLVRVRARLVEASGASHWGSVQSDALSVLTLDPLDASAREAAVETALGRLAAEPYSERQLGRSTLLAMGGAVVPALRRELVAASDPKLVRDLGQVLEELEAAPGRHLGPVLEAHARELGVEVAAPEGWLSEDPLLRGRAILAELRDGPRLAGEAEQFRQWLGVLAGGDPDPGVAALARLASERPRDAGRRLPDGVPAALVPPSLRRPAGSLPGELFEPRSARASILAGLDAHDPRAAWVELLVAEQLWRATPRGEEGAGNMDRLRDALGLVEHHRRLGDPILIDAAAALVSEPGSSLLAWRELAARRLAWPAPVEDLSSVRESFVLEEPSLVELERVLTELYESEASYVDVLLPAGRYADTDSGSSWLELRVPGLRLLGAGPDEVILECGLRTTDQPDVVLQGLSVEHSRGAGVYVAGGSMTLIDVRLLGTDSGASLVRSWLEGERVEVVGDAQRRGSSFSVRMQERCGLLLRDSLLRGGGLFTSGDSALYLESTVLDAGERHLVQGAREGRVHLRDVWARGDGGGLFGLRGGLLEGVLLQVGRDPLGLPASPISLCPEHVQLECQTATRAEPVWLPGCPLHGRGED